MQTNNRSSVALDTASLDVRTTVQNGLVSLQTLRSGTYRRSKVNLECILHHIARTNTRGNTNTAAQGERNPFPYNDLPDQVRPDASALYFQNVGESS